MARMIEIARSVLNIFCFNENGLLIGRQQGIKIGNSVLTVYTTAMFQSQNLYFYSEAGYLGEVRDDIPMSFHGRDDRFLIEVFPRWNMAGRDVPNAQITPRLFHTENQRVAAISITNFPIETHFSVGTIKVPNANIYGNHLDPVSTISFIPEKAGTPILTTDAKIIGLFYSKTPCGKYGMMLPII